MEELKNTIENHFKGDINANIIELVRKDDKDFYHRDHLIEIYRPFNHHSIYICFANEEQQIEVWRGIDKEYHEEDYYFISEMDKCLSDLVDYLEIA